MKVIKRSTMPDGTSIQIEDWREDYPTVFENYSIGAYPIAQRTSKYKLIEDGRKFRLDITSLNAEDDVEQVFQDLENGTITLESLSDHFWNGEKDMWYLGMNVENQGY